MTAHIVVSSSLTLVYDIIIHLTKFCSNCGATETTTCWHSDRNGDSYCHKCHMRLVDNPKYHPLTNPRRIRYKGKTVFVDEPPRKGVCKLCGAKVGHLH